MQRDVGIIMRANDRRALKARHVARNGGELVLPQPAQDVRRGLDAGEVGRRALGERQLLLQAQRVVRGREAAADEEDVTRGEDDVLLCDDAL